jgi:hypothetical protein
LDGESIERTIDGDSLTKRIGQLDKVQMRLRSRFDFLPKKTSIHFEKPFDVMKCFKLKNPGTNILTVGGVIYKMNNDEEIYEIKLPPVSMQVLITQADIDLFRNYAVH